MGLLYTNMHSYTVPVVSYKVYGTYSVTVVTLFESLNTALLPYLLPFLDVHNDDGNEAQWGAKQVVNSSDNTFFLAPTDGSTETTVNSSTQSEVEPRKWR